MKRRPVRVLVCLRVLSICVVLAAGATACTRGGGPSGSTPTGRPSLRPSSPGNPTPSGGARTAEVWLIREGALFLAHRTIGPTPAIGAAAIHALLRGPTPLERSVGVGTAVPPATRLLGLSIAGGVATIDLSAAFGAEAGGLEAALRVGQVVQTLTQFRTVRTVAFLIEGRPVTALAGEGPILDHPIGRAALAHLLPPIVVAAPAVGARVTSPMRVAGTANVFEAVVSIRVRDAAGHLLVDTRTRATCGTGCRGTYTALVSFRVTVPTPAELQVFEVSAKDGSPIHVVRIPLTLLP